MNEKLLHIAKEYASEKSLLNLKGNILIMLMEFYVKHQQDVNKTTNVLDEAFNSLKTKDDQQKLLEIETLYAHAGGKF